MKKSGENSHCASSYPEGKVAQEGLEKGGSLQSDAEGTPEKRHPNTSHEKRADAERLFIKPRGKGIGLGKKEKIPQREEADRGKAQKRGEGLLRKKKRSSPQQQLGVL